MSDIVEFLRARYTEARAAEAGKRAIPGGLPFRWTAVYTRDDPHFLINDVHQVSEDEFMEKYGEPSADPDVLADLDSKLGIVDWYEVASSSPQLNRDAWQVMRQVLLLLAVPFAAHPDYDERWRP